MPARLNWWNLKRNRCPKCNRDFVTSAKAMHGTIICKCGFMIDEDRMQEIVTDLNNNQIKRELDLMEQDRKNFKLDSEV